MSSLEGEIRYWHKVRSRGISADSPSSGFGSLPIEELDRYVAIFDEPDPAEIIEKSSGPQPGNVAVGLAEAIELRSKL